MALVRKTKTLENEISNKLRSLQIKAANRRVSTLGVPGAELAYRIADNAFYTNAQRKTLADLNDLPGKYVQDDFKLKVVFLEPNEMEDDNNKGILGINDTSRYYGQNYYATEQPNQSAKARAKTQAGNPQILLPLNFNNEFNFYSGQVFFRVQPELHSTHCINVFIVSEALAHEIDSGSFKQNQYKKLRHDELPEITKIIEQLTTEYNEFNKEYQQTYQTSKYIFDTLWPRVRSLNAAVKHFPGITSYIDAETKVRLYRKTERNLTPGNDHLAPPQEVMVATAKHKLLRDDNDDD